ncbi:MAG: hypothetical protein IT361_04155 [Gemmatimonadaceae bacterium]|nr:hypothetical protein [Gemmatimonadaceae bacterium]
MNPIQRSAGLARSLLVVFGLAACKLDDLSSSLEPEVGTGQVYTLVTVNERAIPLTLTENGISFEIQRGALTLAADSSWILSFVVRQAGAGASQRTVSTQRGRYTHPQVNTVRLTPSPTDTVARFLGTYSPTAVVLTDQSVPNGDRLGFTK